MVRISSMAAVVACLLSTALAAPATHNAIQELGIFPRQATGSVTTINAGAGAVGKGQGNQFIGGGCVNGADCNSSACCAGGAISGSTGRTGVGVCSGVGSGVDFQKGKTGCGFQDPNAQTTVAEAAAQAKKQGF